MRFYFLILLFAPIVNLVRSDIPPNPNPYYVKNANGVSQGPIFLKGGVTGSWEEDEEGYSVLPDSKRNYFYLKFNASSGDVFATTLPMRKKVNGVLVGSSPSTYGIPRHARPSKDVQMRKCGEFCEKNNNGRDRQLRNLVSTKGTLKNLMVLFRFSDHVNRTLPSPENITTLMNHPGNGVNVTYHSLAPTGSVRFAFLFFSYDLLNRHFAFQHFVVQLFKRALPQKFPWSANHQFCCYELGYSGLHRSLLLWRTTWTSDRRSYLYPKRSV
jgi:hypothetical protein